MADRLIGRKRAAEMFGVTANTIGRWADEGKLPVAQRTLGGQVRFSEGVLQQLASKDHKYLSTACLHSAHGRCRLTCKFCNARCICACHRED